MAVVVAVIGYLPVRAETDDAGPAAASATISHHHQVALSVTCCHTSAKQGADALRREALQIAHSALLTKTPTIRVTVCRLAGSVCQQ